MHPINVILCPECKPRVQIMHFRPALEICRMYDTDKSGTISYEEFQGLVRSRSTKVRCSMTSAVVKHPISLQHQFLMDMHASFKHFDADRSGALERGEVHQALSHSGALHAQVLIPRCATNCCTKLAPRPPPRDSSPSRAASVRAMGGCCLCQSHGRVPPARRCAQWLQRRFECPGRPCTSAMRVARRAQAARCERACTTCRLQPG